MRLRIHILRVPLLAIAVACHAMPAVVRAEEPEAELSAALDFLGPSRGVGEQPAGAFGEEAPIPNRPGYWSDFDPYLAVQRSAPAPGVVSDSPRPEDSPFTKDELREVEVLIGQLRKTRTDACRTRNPSTVAETVANVASEAVRLRQGLEATHSAVEASLSEVERELRANEMKLKDLDTRRSPIREELENKVHALEFDAQDLRKRSQWASNALGSLTDLSNPAAACGAKSETPSNLRPHRPGDSGTKFLGNKPAAIPNHDVLPKLKEMKGSLRP